MPWLARCSGAGGNGASRLPRQRNWFVGLADLRARTFSGPADPRLGRALCIVAHPDDVDFFAAGTVLLMTRNGVTVDFVLATSGDKGSRHPSTSGAQLAASREREQLASAAVLGAGRVEFLRHRDAELVDTLALRGQLVREIRLS